MKKVLVCAVAILLVVSAAGSSYAMMGGKGMSMGDMGMRHMGMGMGHDAHMLDKLMTLGLDEKQMEAVRTVHFNLKKEVIRKNAEVDIAEMELKEILHKDKADIKAAEAKIRQVESLKSEVMIAHVKALEAVKEKLTPEQRKKFASIMQEKHGRHGGDMMGKCGMMQDDGHKGHHGAGSPDKKEEAAAAPAGRHQH